MAAAGWLCEHRHQSAASVRLRPGVPRQSGQHPALVQPCMREHRSPTTEAWCALQGRCLRWITTERASIAELARRVGVDQSRIQYWFRNERSTLPTTVLGGVADLVGITLDQAIVEAGGRTAEQEKSEHGRRLATWNADPSRREDLAAAGRKGGAGNRGRRVPHEVVEKRQATARANGAADRAVTGLARESRSAPGRVRRSLIAHLRWETYSARNVRRWLKETSRRVPMCSAEVLAIWASALQREGLPRPAGRHSDLDRCRELRDMLTAVERSPSGRLPHRFWPDAGERLSVNYDVLRQWSVDHRETCGVLDDALAQPQRIAVEKA